MAFSCKNALIINSIYITHMKAHGKGRECVKKKIKVNRFYEAKNKI